MRRIQLLTMRWFFIIALVVVGMSAIPLVVEAGTPGQEGIFTISDLIVSPTEADTGQTITISATIKETNNVSGIYEGTLRINGTVEETKSVTVEPNGSKPITFAISRNVAGTYSVDLDGLTGSFTVTGEPIAESDSSFPTVPVIFGIVAAVVIVGLLIFYLNRRKTT